jgi:flavin-dependent dehydrogenase
MRHDAETIKILGAGPAGLTAAIGLARAGCRVTVYERAPDVGTRRDGDLEALEDFTMRESVWDEFARWGIERNFHSVPIHSLTCFGPGFRDGITACDTAPLMHFVTRGPQDGSFDRALLAQACQAGVRIEFNRSATPSDVDIVAGGLRRPQAFAMGYNFTTSAPNGAYVGLDDQLAPQAYSYLALCDGRGTIAACAFGPRRGMQTNLQRVLSGFHSRLDFDMREPRYFAASVTYGLPHTACRDGRLYAGEAAEVQDIWTGFGMRLAMAMGHLAARSILDGSDYDRAWRARCAPLLQAATVNRALQRVLGNAGYYLVRFLMGRSANQARALLHRHYNPTWYSTLLWPLARRIVFANRRRLPA